MLTQIAFGFHGNQTNKFMTSRTHQALSIVTMATGGDSITHTITPRVFYAVDIMWSSLFRVQFQWKREIQMPLKYKYLRAQKCKSCLCKRQLETGFQNRPKSNNCSWRAIAGRSLNTYVYAIRVCRLKRYVYAICRLNRYVYAICRL